MPKGIILMKENQIVYLDNAATSFPKPESVIRGTTNALRYRSGNPGRSGHSLSMAASRDIYSLRQTASEFFSAPSPENVIVTPGNTYSLNYAIYTLSEKGGAALCSDMEHNAVRRPLIAATGRGLVYFEFRAGDIGDNEMLSRLEAQIKAVRPSFIVCNHSCNIFARTLPIEEIGKICAENCVMFIVDAAQSAGHTNIDVKQCNIDALCVPGHKGLYGPSGVGLMIVSDRFKEATIGMPTLISGGAGTASLDEGMPQEIPERFEPGTQPSFLCAGLEQGIKLVKSIGLDRIKARENYLFSLILNSLMERERDVLLYRPELKKGNVLSFNIKGMSCGRAAGLFSQHGVCLRSGFHCSPQAHKLIGTLPIGGSVRASVGIFNNERDIRYFADVLDEVIRCGRKTARKE